MVALGLLSCAGVQLPPGGPRDVTPPVLERAVPASGTTRVSREATVRLHFSESVEVREVASAVLLSPRTTLVSYDHHGSEIILRPRGQWAEATAYQITLLPTITDVTERNPLREVTYLFFTTGDSLPEGGVRGRITAQDQPQRGVRVETFRLPDSLQYLTATDSSGVYLLGAMPAGDYSLQAYQDQNGDERYDLGQEPGARGPISVEAEVMSLDLEIAVEDVTPPRATGASLQDSLTVAVVFDDALDPNQPLMSEDFSVVSVTDSLDVRRILDVKVDSLKATVLTLTLADPITESGEFWVHLGPLKNRAGLGLPEGGRRVVLRVDAKRGDG